MTQTTIEELRSLLQNHITLVSDLVDWYVFPAGSCFHKIFPINQEPAWSYTLENTTFLNHPRTTIKRRNTSLSKAGDYCFFMSCDNSNIARGQLEVINPDGTTLTHFFPRRVELIQEASDSGFIARLDDFSCCDAITADLLTTYSTGFTITREGERLYQNLDFQKFFNRYGATKYTAPFQIEPHRIQLENSVWLACYNRKEQAIVNPNTEEVRKFPVEIESPTVFTVDGRSCFVGGGYGSLPRGFYDCTTTEKVREIPDPVIPREMISFAGRSCIRFDTNVKGLDGINFWYHEERGTHIKTFSSWSSFVSTPRGDYAIDRDFSSEKNRIVEIIQKEMVDVSLTKLHSLLEIYSRVLGKVE